MSAGLVHAGCIAIDGRGILLRGGSGAGKSDLALRLLDRGHALIADDYVDLRAAGRYLVASAPPPLLGKIEVRGIGIVDWPATQWVKVALLLDIGSAPARLPEPETELLCGIAVPRLAIAPFEASAPIKVELALRLHGLALD